MVVNKVIEPPSTSSRTGGAGGGPKGGAGNRSVNVITLLAKVLGLGIVLGSAVALTPALLTGERWLFLVIVWAIALLALLTYATGRGLPAKYLLPGSLLLTVFVVYPVLATMQISTTNFGDGTRSSKAETIAQIVSASVTQTPDAPRYNLAVGTKGSATDGPFTFFLVNKADNTVSRGDEKGLTPLGAGDATVTNGFVTAAPGYTMLTPVQVNKAGAAVTKIAVPTSKGAIRSLGIRQAFEGVVSLKYDDKTDTITDTVKGVTYHVQAEPGSDRSYFVDDKGARLSDQSWQQSVGLDNYKRVFTDSRISSNFFGIFLWTILFAVGSVGSTFLLGLLLAVTLNDSRVRGQRFYRSVLLLPYAIPGFISLLVWSGFFNRDFGLINSLTGLNVDWFGNVGTARFAVLLTNLWMGFPYMFLVCIGALQAVPPDLKEAASIDGASGFMGFRKITFPLLMVTVAPLMVSSFAFNFNNFNAIQLLTQGGPFDPANPTAGGTDILISYTIRLAFGAGGARLGFASAISVLLFVLTGIIAAIQFRATRSLEDVN
jgi:arabinogalactan oligomer / maltooligosaccharide transport system permease protein